jgi:ABC-type multidrug transport system permease subunit
MSELGIQSSFNQYCGYNANCYVIDETGNLQSVPCGDYLTNALSSTLKLAVPWIFIGLAIFTVLIFMIVFFATRASGTDNDKDNKSPINKDQNKNIRYQSNIIT